MMQNSVPKRRLQRPAKDQNCLISTFNQVLARHFLTMAVIAGICIFIAIAMMWFFREEFDNDDISDY